MSIRLRRATAHDVQEYIRIANSVVSPINKVETDAAKIMEDIRHNWVFMILFCGERKEDVQTIGLISYERPNPYEAYISEFAVDPTYQRRGVGRAALHTVLGILRQGGMASVFLLTHKDNPARKLYERRFHFDAMGMVENFRGTGELRMKLRLDL